jgi:hypothetical protein
MSRLCDLSSSSSIATIPTSNRTKKQVYNNMTQMSVDSPSSKDKEVTLNEQLNKAKQLCYEKLQEYKMHQKSNDEESRGEANYKVREAETKVKEAENKVEFAKLKANEADRIWDANVCKLNAAFKNRSKISQKVELNEYWDRVKELEKKIKKPPQEINVEEGGSPFLSKSSNGTS